jgi:hypothetical protein
MTAVEFLVTKLNNKVDYIPIKIWDEVREIIQQALEIEKQQIERMYSEEEVIEILLNFRGENPRYIEEWFEQFKKITYDSSRMVKK